MQPPDPLAASRSSRFRIGLGAAVVLVIAGLAIAVLVSALTGAGGSRTVVAASGQSAAPTPATGGAIIFVHIIGEVARPGLYSLREGDRAIDAIAAAGGYTQQADRRLLNLARFLSDGEQISVPAIGEQPAAGPSGMAGGKVNLNTADAPILETLPGVGPAMAQRIIAWRTTNGRFATIDDLMSVSGIGEKTFEQLKDLVTT